MLKEFKEFSSRGNIMDLAVGVIIGGAFQKIVTSLVDDIIMPAISALTGKIDLTSLSINFGQISIKYGSFINTVINFLIIAFSVFLFVRYINKLNRQIEKVTEENIKKLEKKGKFVKKKENVPPPTTQVCPFCFSEINIKATRCSNCTSIIEKKDSNSNQT